jgi:hypothetical protein
MSAQDNLSQELFFDAHRGLSNTTGKKIRPGLGMHWSADPVMATYFAENTGGPDGELTDKPGVILHARIPISSVETHTQTLINRQVGEHSEYADHSDEEEIPVKLGAPVHVVGRTSIPADKSEYMEGFSPRMRRRNYNPPRKMYA